MSRINPFKQLGLLAGYLAVPVTIILALGLISVRRFEWYIIVGLIVLLVLVALFAVTNPEVWQRRLGRQRVSSTISGAVVIIALVGIVALVNVLMQRTNTQFDLTKNKSFTISDTSAKIIGQVKNPTTAIIFYNQSTLDQQQRASDLLKQYATRNDKLTVQSINIDQDPVSVQRYAVSSNPAVIFEQGQRRENTSSVDEQSFSRTLLKLQNPPKRVLIVTGHQEFPTQAASQNGNSLATAIQGLTDNNYKVEIYNSVAGTSASNTPADPTTGTAAPTGTPTQLNPAQDILLIVGSRSKFSDDEKQRYTTFFKQGGKALIAYDVSGNSDAATATNVNDLIADFGVKFDRGITVETDPTRRAQQSAALIIPQPSTTSDVTRSFGAQDALVVANASGVEKNADSKATFTGLLTTSQDSYLKAKLPPTTAEFEQGDVRGPVTVAATAELAASQAAPAISTTTTPIVGGTPGATPTATPASPTPASNTSRLVLMGSAVALSDQLLQAGKNYDFFLNSMNYLSDTGNNIVIASSTADTQPFTLNSGQSSFTFWASFLGLPVLILFLGLVTWWRRR